MNGFVSSLLITGCFFLQSEIYGQHVDINIVKSMNNNQSLDKTNYCRFSDKSISFINVGAPVAVFAAGLIRHDKKLQKNAAYMMGAFILSATVTRTTKMIIKRKRPYEDYTTITKLSSGGGYSFPSGHTSSAFTTATSLSLYFPKWYVIAPACLWASGAGIARIYQGVHYPSDVLAGAIVGVGSAIISYKAQQWFDKKPKRKAHRIL